MKEKNQSLCLIEPTDEMELDVFSQELSTAIRKEKIIIVNLKKAVQQKKTFYKLFEAHIQEYSIQSRKTMELDLYMINPLYLN